MRWIRSWRAWLHVQYYKMAEMAIQPTLHDSNHCKSGFSYDCQYYAAVSTANQLTLWNSKNRKLLQTHDFLSNQLTCIAWSPPSTQIHDSPKVCLASHFLHTISYSMQVQQLVITPMLILFNPFNNTFYHAISRLGRRVKLIRKTLK